MPVGREGLHHGDAQQWEPQLHRDGHRCRRQHQRGLIAFGNNDRRGCTRRAGHCLILHRYRHGDHLTGDNTPTLTGTAEANSTVKLSDNGTLIATVTANASGVWSYTTAALSNGSHSFTATATDAAGNIGAVSATFNITIDTSTPAVPTIASFSTDTGTVGDHITADKTPTLTGTAEASSTVQLFDNGTLIGSVTANAGGAWSYTTATLSNGSHSFTATAANAAGNTSAASSPLAVTIDAVAPSAPTIASFSTDTGTLGDHITSDNTPTLSGTAEANSTVKLSDNGTLIIANGSGVWSYTTAGLSDGSHGFTATATDVAGNTSVASAALNVTIDTVAPAAPIITSFSQDTGTLGDHITGDNTPTLTGTAEANSTVKLFDNGTLIGSVTANASGVWS